MNHPTPRRMRCIVPGHLYNVEHDYTEKCETYGCLPVDPAPTEQDSGKDESPSAKGTVDAPAFWTAEGLPSWDECRDAINDGTATPLEQFIFENEPANAEDAVFRAQLTDLCNWLRLGQIQKQPGEMP